MRTLVVLLIVLGWGFGTGVGLAYLKHAHQTIERLEDRHTKQLNSLRKVLKERWDHDQQRQGE